MEKKLMALTLYTSGLPINKIARPLKISRPVISNPKTIEEVVRSKPIIIKVKG